MFKNTTILALSSLALIGATACNAPASAQTQANTQMPANTQTQTNSQLQVSTQLLTSGKIDLSADTITLPLHRGSLKDGRSVLYILTDVSDQSKAAQYGLVYAPALTHAASVASTRQATRGPNGEFVFDKGTVDFSPVRSLTPGNAPNLFPPQAAQPGSVGDQDYSPYVQVAADGNAIYNAPIVAFDVVADDIATCNGQTVNHDLVHDKVVSICPDQGQVTIALSHGFASGQPLIYISLDANDPTGATLEAATYAPALSSLKNTGATLPLIAVANGAVGKDNTSRQGLDSAISGDGSPLNILSGIPTLEAGYTPLWDIRIGAWTQQAIANNSRVLLTSFQQATQESQAGNFTGFGGGPLASSGIVVNCPAVAILK